MLGRVSKGLNKAVDEANKTAMQVKLDMQAAYYDQEIANAKSKWGRDAFDAFVSGDMSKVQALTRETEEVVRKAQAKKGAVQAKRVGTAQPAGSSSAKQKIQVAIPPGLSAGSQFAAQLESGELVTLTVPSNAQPGSLVIFEVPLEPQVVMGQPVE